MVLNTLQKLSLRGLFLALFLMPSLSYSSTGYLVHNYNHDTTASTPALSCLRMHEISGSVSYTFIPTGGSYGFGTCSTVLPNQSGFNIRSITGYTCPVGEVDDGSGNCVVDNAVTCNLGDILYSSALLTQINTDSYNIGGCEYKQSERVVCFYHPGPDETLCNVEWQSTGNTSSLPEVIIGEPDEPTVPSEATNDNSKTETDVVVEPSVVVTENDGTVTTDESEIETKTENENTNIWESDEFIFVKESDGSTTVTQKNVTTVSNPDGSSSVIEHNQIIENTGSSSQTNIPKDGTLSSTVTITGGDSYVTNEYTTINYGSDGSVTDTSSSSDTNKPGDSSDGEEPEEEGDKLYSYTGSQGNYDNANSQIQLDIAQAKIDLKDTFDQIKLDAEILLDLSVNNGSASLPCFTVNYQLGSFDLCPSDLEGSLSLIPLILLFTFAFISLLIILR